MTLPLALFCLLAAVVCNHVLRGRHVRTRLLVVPGHAVPVYDRLFCVHEIMLAIQLRVPVVFAATLALAGSIHSRLAATSHGEDRDRLRDAMFSYATGVKQSYSQVDWVLYRVLWLHRLAVAFRMLNWMMLVALLQWADRRASSGGSFGERWPALAGVGVGILVDSIAMYCTARDTWRGRGWWFVCAQVYALLLLGTSASMSTLLIHLNRVRPRRDVDRWQFVSEMLTEDCFGFADDGGSCSVTMMFWSGMIQTMFIGGCILTMLSLGAMLCPVRIRCLSLFGLFVLMLVPAAVAAMPSAYSEPLPTATDFQFPVTFYYLTKLLAWALVPCLTMWAAISRWGLTSAGRPKNIQHDPVADLSKESHSSDFVWPEAEVVKVDSI